MSASIQLNGVKELNALLEAYPSSVTKAAGRTGVRKAAQKFRASLNIPTRTGLLRKAVKVRGRRADKTSVRFFVGLGKIKGESNIRGYYKTLEMNTKRGGPLRPFLLPAYNAQKEALAQLIVDETRKAVYDQAARINRRVLGISKRKR